MDEPTTDLNVSLDGEGYLTDFSQWTREAALQIAKAEQIEMTDQHWQVIDYLQECDRNSVPLSIRTFKKQGPVSIKEFTPCFLAVH